MPPSRRLESIVADMDMTLYLVGARCTFRWTYPGTPRPGHEYDLQSSAVRRTARALRLPGAALARRRSLRQRTRVFTLFLLQLALVGAAPYADARLEAREGHGSVHLDSSSTDCNVGHDHFLCTVCRALTLGATPSAASDGLSSGLPTDLLASASAEHVRAGAIEATSRLSRAPPLS